MREGDRCESESEDLSEDLMSQVSETMCVSE